MNNQLKLKLQNLPRSPGVYFHKSSSGEVIYVGKAAVLRNRVRQYFQTSRNIDAKTQALVAEICDVDWLETESEIDALFLESEMVKRYMPRYNVLLRDDKSQSYVRIDMKSEWPHVSLTRHPHDDGAEYYGPYYNAYSLKKALRYLRPVFPHYTKEPHRVGSKLEAQIGLNPDTTLGSADYKANLRKLISYLKGNRKLLMREFEAAMKQAAQRHDFERAAEYRNKIQHMRELQRRIMFGDREFLDISKDRALADLATIFGLGTLRRIEGFDISHHGGNNVVASMVVFTNGVSDRSEYRKFKMTQQTNDDTAQMYEALHRRLSERNIKSWGSADLLLIDGGKGQLSAAIQAMRDRGLTYPIIAIAKREDELIVHRQSNIKLAFTDSHLPAGVAIRREAEFTIINLHAGQRNLGPHTRNLRGESSQSPYSDVVKLFQRIRDEAHRFAVSYHTTLKRSGATKSQLDDIPGVGPVRKRQLLRHLGSLRALQLASVDDLTRVIGPKLARQVAQYLSEDRSR